MNPVTFCFELQHKCVKHTVHTTVKIVSCSSNVSPWLFALGERLLRSLGKGAHCRSTSGMVTSMKYQKESKGACDGGDACGLLVLIENFKKKV